METTTTDIGSSTWCATDAPFRLRQWGSDLVHLLPDDRSVEVVVGRHPVCGIRITDERVSKHHARLYHHENRWRLRDLGTKNKLVVDGSVCDEIILEPGLIIGIGGVAWIVESPQLVELRSFLSRLIGYGTEKLHDVDSAVRSVRLAAIGQSPLVLHGEGDLVAVARSLHRRVLGDARPFIVCDPRRQRSGATVRSAENYQSAGAAMQAAIGGSLCVWSRRVPRDFGLVSIAHREPNPRFQLIMCAHEAPDIRPHQVLPVVIPPLARRGNEVARIIDEYAADARTSLGVSTTLHVADREWLARNAGATHSEIEKGAHRVIALRATRGNIAAAAGMLRMSHSSLGRWLAERRPLASLRG